MNTLKALPIALCLLAPAAVDAQPARPSAAPSGQEVRYNFLYGGNPAGSAITRAASEREWVATFEFNDRGRGPSTTTRWTLDEQGLPVRVETTGHDYWKTPVDERFERTAAKAAWTNASEREERPWDRPAFYMALNSPPQEAELLARALLRAPEGRIALLPTGEARIERAGSRQVTQRGETRTVDLYAISGGGFAPYYFWLDDQKRLFAQVDGWSTLVREGWEGVAAELLEAQEAKAAERERELARRLARRPAGALAIRHARLFDPETGATRPDTTVVISGNRIAAVGRDGEVQIPQGAEVIDAGGKLLMPGLWDMHVHIGALDGILHLAAGVTTVRDLANDTDQLLDLRRRFDAGETLGPRVLLAGFIDGPGPYAGPTKVLVDTKEEALAAVDRYHELGYVQIKLYSSLDPKLVPPIVERAHRHGMRVSGHIPNGMTTEQAVRAGFDEIQHANFLVLNFLDGVDTRTPARFTAVGEHAAGLDLGSGKMRAFVQLLKDRKTVVDPTINGFESMFTDRPGTMSRGIAAAADRLPPLVQRGFRGGGGGLKPPEGMDQRYRDSFASLLRFVRVLYDAGVPLVAGTDELAGFFLHRELELYAEAGIPAPEVLRIATLGAARVMKREADLGTIAPGKLADLILVDGDPAVRISDIRRVALTVKDGVIYDPAALYAAVGVKPAV